MGKILGGCFIMEQYEIMEQSIMKNIQELSELCVSNSITNIYDLMDIVVFYNELLEKAKLNDGKVMVKLESEEK
jgi:hypothetical protein